MEASFAPVFPDGVVAVRKKKMPKDTSIKSVLIICATNSIISRSIGYTFRKIRGKGNSNSAAIFTIRFFQQIFCLLLKRLVQRYDPLRCV